jgi:hypothetical protein
MAEQQATRDHGQSFLEKEDLYGTKSHAVYGIWKTEDEMLRGNRRHTMVVIENYFIKKRMW